MKKILLTIIGLAMASPAWSAQTAVTEISGIQPSVGALKTQVNTKLGTVESNRQDHETRVAAMESGKETKAVVQASAPADTTVDWYDTDQESGVLILKRHNGTTWLRASSHGVQYASSCASITAGMCVDTDDGKLYYHTGTAVVEVGTGTGGATVIDDLTDVDTTGKATGKILKFDASGNLVVGDDSTGSGSVPSGTVNGQVLLWSTDQWVASTAPWVTTASLGTGVAAALASPVDGTGGLASKVALDALPNLVFGTGIAVAEDTPSAGTDTVSIDVDTIPTSGSAKPLTSGGAYTALAGKEPTDSTIVKVAEIDTQAEFEALVGWTLPSGGGVGGYVTAPAYSDSPCTAGTYSFHATYGVVYCKATNTWDYQVVSGSSLAWAAWNSPTPVTYAATLTITDTSATGDTFTLNSIAYDAADSPVSVTNLPTATEQITYTGSNTADCTGDVTGTGPWTINASPATVGCTITEAGEYTLIADQTVNDSSVSLATYRAGVVFSVPTSFTTIKSTWTITGASGTCEVRFDDEDFMTSEYLASTTFTPSSGANAISLDVGSRTAGTYYLAVSCPNGNIARADTEQNVNITYRYVDYVANPGSWQISTEGTRDWTLKLEYK